MATTFVQTKDDELRSMRKSCIDMYLNGGLKDDQLKLSQEKMAWWQDAKIGMMIHWGLYAIPARGEWVMFREGYTPEAYRHLAEEFRPMHFSAEQWADVAVSMGAKYSIMTTRHHDGFSLWDSAGSVGRFTSAHTAAGRDFVRPYLQAFRGKSIRAGLYYSPMD